jgi:TolA-binding protein
LGLRFRKSISLGKGVRLNFSKSGVGVSAGVKGYRVGVGPRGVRKTVSIPGTGISYVEEKSFKSLAREGKSANNPREKVPVANSPGGNIPLRTPKGYGWLWGIILGFILLFSIPLFGVPLLLISCFYFYKALKDPVNQMVNEYNNGVNQLKSGNFNSAEKHFINVLNYNPNDTLTLVFLTFIYYSKGDYQKVVANHHKITEYLPEDPELTYILAQSYFQLRNYDQAIPLLQQINSYDGIKDEVNILLGRCFLEKGLLEVAVEQFRKGPVLKRTMTPEVMEAKYWLGVTYYKLGDKKKALTQLQRVYAEDINYRDVAKYIENLI